VNEGSQPETGFPASVFGAYLSYGATVTGCGPLANDVTLIADSIPWTRVRFYESFYNYASCWGIFGGTYGTSSSPNLLPFDAAIDTIYNQYNMGGSQAAFDGTDVRCDNTSQNFWHDGNGSGPSHDATVILRRNVASSPAGLSTGVGCIYQANLSWTYQNIWVR
jgi:hypothetical protein